jgi:FKBP-type peptidyl-prolyl cis-trans isomerase SlyD
MKISKDKVVSIEYTLTDAEGEVLDTSEGVGPLEYIHGRENIIPGLERELDGKEPGAVFSAIVEAVDGYGEHNKDLVVVVPRNQFDADADIAEGMQFEAESPDGSRVVTVVAVSKDSVTVDANHPLAGEKLFFDIKVISVREATEDELTNGLEDDCGCGCGDHSCGDDDECCGGHGGCGCH